MRKKIICIVGATASGKTALSIELAKQINAEIISADSMQIYKGMDLRLCQLNLQVFVFLFVLFVL